MANNSRLLRRDKRKLEPISIDELAGDSTMTGFSDLFRIPTTPAPSSPSTLTGNWKRPIDILKSDTYTLSTEVVDPTIEDNSVRSTLVSAPKPDEAGTPHRQVQRYEVELGPSETGEHGLANTTNDTTEHSKHKQDFNVPGFLDSSQVGRTNSVAFGEGDPFVPSPFPRKLQIREAKLVQEGHTYGEQTVYESLWKNGTIVSDSTRVITIGFLRMANLAGLAESNCKVAVAGLLEKLAIHRLPGGNVSLGRSYRVYSWAAVLARRKAAGLTHVIKSRGVVFVNPKTGEKLTIAKTLPRRRHQGLDLAASVGVPDQNPNAGLSFHPARIPVEVNANPSSTVSAETLQPRSALIDSLASRLRNDLDPLFDDSAAGRLWRECHKSVPDCTVDEILHFALLKAKTIYRDRNIRNPIGLLLMSIPEFFTGNAVHELREHKMRHDTELKEMQDQQRKYWGKVANDLKLPPEERELALRFLRDID